MGVQTASGSTPSGTRRCLVPALPRKAGWDSLATALLLQAAEDLTASRQEAERDEAAAWLRSHDAEMLMAHLGFNPGRVLRKLELAE